MEPELALGLSPEHKKGVRLRHLYVFLLKYRLDSKKLPEFLGFKNMCIMAVIKNKIKK